MIRRRDFITFLGGAAAWPLAAWAQQGDRMRRIGVLMSYDENDPVAEARVSAFTQALAGLGWNDRRKVRLEVRWGGGDADRMRALAQELVGLHPDVIATNGVPATAAVQRETRAIPIVFAGVNDPVPSGLVTRLDRPGGNVTGFAAARKPRWEARTLSCFRRSRPGSSGPQSCSIPTTHSFLCPILRRRPGYSRSC